MQDVHIIIVECDGLCGCHEKAYNSCTSRVLGLPILTLYCHFLQGEIALWYYWQWGCRPPSTQSSSQSNFWRSATFGTNNIAVFLPPATDPFYGLFWLSIPNKVGSHAEELQVLTNLQDKLKHHMHAHHYLSEANTDTLLYKLWQKLYDIRPSVQHSPTLTHSNLMQSPLLSTHFGPCQMWLFKEQEQVLE